MKKSFSTIIAVLLCVLLPATYVFGQPISAAKIAGFAIEDAEIATYSAEHQAVYISAKSTIEIISIADPAAPDVSSKISIDISAYGSAVNSVAVYGDLVAAAVENEDAQANGSVVFFDHAGTFLAGFDAGALPDMVTFTPDGNYVLVANEGEPNDEYTLDPEGSLTVIDISQGLAQAQVTQVGFTSFNSSKDDLIAEGIRIFGPGATVAQDLEPEYIAVSDDSHTAWVTLQENNAVAELDIATKTVSAIHPLGYKSYDSRSRGIDASDKDGAINIRRYPVLGMYQPDAIAAFNHAGRTYLITANEGDARDYDGFSEEARVEDLTLDPEAFPEAGALQAADVLGRLKTSTVMGDTDSDGDNDLIYSYGARSFSVWKPHKGTLKQQYDSGNKLAKITAALHPEAFNCNDGIISEFDKRSDDKGIEPEGVTVGTIGDRRYAFIGLERGLGGIMIFDITNPREPAFVTWVLSNNGSGADGNDIAPEGIAFIAPESSPNGKALLVGTFEESGSVAIYELSLQQDTQISIAPQAGTIGTSLIITGHNFGSKSGKVRIGNKSAKTILWTDTLIQCTLFNQMKPGTYDVTITPYKAEPILFSDYYTVSLPEVSTIDPPQGAAAGESVMLTGKYFGSAKAKLRVYLYDGCSKTIAPDLTYTMDPLTGESTCTFTMPDLPPSTYDLKLRTLIGWSEPIPYECINPDYQDLRTISVVSTNDFHGALVGRVHSWSNGDAVGGADWLAGYLNIIRDENPKGYLFVDAGDMMQGTLTSNYFYGEPTIDVFNEMDLKATALGNHEFDWGLSILADRMAQAGFPFISANIMYRDHKDRLRHWCTPYIIKKINGIKVGIIGLTTTDTPIITNPVHVADLEFVEPAAAVTGLIPELQQKGVTMVVVVAHMGGFWNSSSAAVEGEVADLACALDADDVDLIVSGHTHSRIDEVICDIPVVQAYSGGTAFARVDVSVDVYNKRVVGYDMNEFPTTTYQTYSGSPATYEGVTVSPDPNVAAIVGLYEAQIDDIKNQVLGQTTAPITRQYRYESVMGDWVTDIMRTYESGIDFALTNSGGLRTDIDAGDITFGEVYEALPFDNSLVVVELDGNEVRQVLEEGVTGAHGVVQVSGLQFTFDYDAPAGSRIIGDIIDLNTSLPIDPVALYQVAVNDFMANGGDGYATLAANPQTNTFFLVRDIVVSWIMANSPFTAPDPTVEQRMTALGTPPS